MSIDSEPNRKTILLILLYIGHSNAVSLLYIQSKVNFFKQATTPLTEEVNY